MGNKSFIRKLLVYITGSLAAQILSFMLMPIVTRTYSPESLGVINKFIAIANIAIPLFTLSLVYSIVLTKSNLVSVIKVICSNLIFFTIVAYVFIFFMWEWSSVAKHQVYWFLLPIYILSYSLTQIGEQISVKYENFKKISYANFLQSAVNNFFKLMLPLFFTPGYFLLILSSIVGVASTFLLYTKDIFFFKIKKLFSYKRTLKVLQCNSNFVFFQTPQNIINALSQGFPVLIISALFGDNMAGQYGLANTLMLIPISLLGTAIINITYSKITEIFKFGKNLSNYLIKFVLVMLCFSTVIFSPIFFWGDDLFSIFFGHEWKISGELASFLVPSFIFILASRPVIPAIYIYKIQYYLLLNEIIGIVLRCAGLFAGYYYFQSASISVLLFSLSNIIVYSLLCVQVLIKSRKLEHYKK
ncbi:lipopolysaccharide biosynthesis protein [Xenorhabdus japonica]|uniref:Membrane protein involved in the export of O-antigen and teichoic acid n=1 Tax=Xenorhabdus japonica TaxID=53341 RepID=A0A1I5E600_9GAMM|nr:oligosaccharide flippase family protein [Xenorhabdus japonica]SFO06969.1 Membrane protein involved in the export of O-antigen and teichoic acid [Xenorhabdus japonica]